jgi:septation ring formation regulator EzrA
VLLQELNTALTAQCDVLKKEMHDIAKSNSDIDKAKFDDKLESLTKALAEKDAEIVKLKMTAMSMKTAIQSMKTTINQLNIE